MAEVVLVTSEAAKYIRMGEDGLRKLAAEGKIPHFHVGRDYRFIQSLLDTWLIESALQEESPSTGETMPKRGTRTYTSGASVLDAALANAKKKRQDKLRSSSPQKKSKPQTKATPSSTPLQTG